MNNWKKCKLGDIIDVKHGYAFKGHGITSKDNNKILVTPGNFNIGGGFKMDKCKYFEGDFPENYILKHNDIVLTMTDLSVDSDTLGYSAKIPNIKNKIFLHNQRIGLVIFNDNCVDKDFIYWLTRSPEYHNYIVCSSTGTSIRHTSPRLIKEFVFELPPLEEQRRIAVILSNIDDKIELLHEQNKTLEELAQTLFRNYFIENPNPSWQNVKIKELASITSGKSLKRLDMQDDGENPILGANGIIGFTNKYLYNEPLLYTGRVGTLGKVFMINSAKKVWLSDNTLIIKPSSNFYFMYFVLKTSSLENLDVGSTQPLIRQSDLGEIEILLADDLLLEKFDITAKKIFDKIDKNLEQIQTLENMRDILIPKLLNGEIKVGGNQ
ncbi:restriction endonuclease subunit S [Campylobacter lari]|uniref:restriction endonuclease subunit S n=1 Tax=Campylobacter lari TaxID=201 RepID=UPI001BD9FD92|nr:restriction endonuclease subunit S [Campylobacter lari]MBT0827394.1 restriction endonuclease subunit S [Campylobacter lari]MCR6547768.1 restriction endonuclease subunit S [Campylobacter lari]